MKERIFIALLTFSLLLIGSTSVRATTPTPAPTAGCDGCDNAPSGSYSRSSLLAKIGPKPYTSNPNLLNIDLLPKVVDTTLDGASWGLTFISIFNDGGVLFFLAGIVVLFLIAFWLRKTIIQQMRKTPISPLEMRLRALRQQAQPFLNEVGDYRSFNRTGKFRRSDNGETYRIRSNIGKHGGFNVEDFPTQQKPRRIYNRKYRRD